jgi:hypothetical protein
MHSALSAFTDMKLGYPRFILLSTAKTGKHEAPVTAVGLLAPLLRTRKTPVKMSALAQAVLTEYIRGFLQSLKTNFWITLQFRARLLPSVYFSVQDFLLVIQ